MNKRVCPVDSTHKRFVTVAYVSEDWLVDDDGNFIEAMDTGGEVLHGPNHGNIWTCAECDCDETEGRLK